MRIFHLCLVSFAVLAFGPCAFAQPELAPNAPPRGEAGPAGASMAHDHQAGGPQVYRPPIPAGARVEVEPLPSCFRIMRLRYGAANEIVPLFRPIAGTMAMEPFLPRGVCVSRAGDNALLVTAGDEESLDQVERLVGLLDRPPLHLILEIMLVDSPREVQLPAAGGAPLIDELAIFLRLPDVTIYRTFLDISMGQQGVLDLEPYPLPARALLFSEAIIHNDNIITLTMRALAREDGPEVPKGSLLTVKNGTTLLPAMKPVRDEAGNPHYYYLLAGLNACRDDRVHLADGARLRRGCSR